MTNIYYANFVSMIHLILIILIISFPFSNTPMFLFFHIIFIPFIIFHWLVNNDTCVLTLIEKKLRGINDEKDLEKKCYTQQILSPIFKFANNYKEFSRFTYASVIILWSLSLSKLLFDVDKGIVKNLTDICRL